MSLLEWALALFVVAALGGAFMAIRRLSGKTNPPVVVAVLHGVLAACGLGVLVTMVSAGTDPFIIYALVVFALAALGGLWMAFGYHARGRLLPVAMVIGHAVLALVAIVLLLAQWLAPAAAGPQAGL